MIRRDEMIFKILYQETLTEVPVRERTNSIYIKAKSEREVRQLLKDRKYNIEYIQPLREAHLEYEKLSENFTVENV